MKVSDFVNIARYSIDNNNLSMVSPEIITTGGKVDAEGDLFVLKLDSLYSFDEFLTLYSNHGKSTRMGDTTMSIDDFSKDVMLVIKSYTSTMNFISLDEIVSIKFKLYS